MRGFDPGFPLWGKPVLTKNNVVLEKLKRRKIAQTDRFLFEKALKRQKAGKKFGQASLLFYICALTTSRQPKTGTPTLTSQANQ